MKKSQEKSAARLRRKRSIRKKIHGDESRPRLSVFRSGKHIYAQVIDDEQGITLASASSLSEEVRKEAEGLKKSEVSTLVGKLLATRCLGLENKIERVVFDRNGFIYHGRVKAVADGAREAGLQF